MLGAAAANTPGGVGPSLPEMAPPELERGFRPSVEAHDKPQVVVYWRPGCGFCVRLARALDSMDIEPELRNIWEEPDAAEFVRSVNNGNELVPTVVVGDVVLSAPSAADVSDALAGAR